MITAEQVRSLLDYNPETGVFTWRSRTVRPEFLRTDLTWNARYAGKPAGCDNGSGYIRIDVNSHGYKAHRLAWLYVHGQWPTLPIDHINGDRCDNRISNLRIATHAENARNTKMRATNKSGVKGVSKAKDNRWRAQIQVNRKKLHLGFFDTIDEAAEAYRIASIHLHGNFASSGVTDIASELYRTNRSAA